MDKEVYFEKIAQELLKRISAQTIEIAQLQIRIAELEGDTE